MMQFGQPIGLYALAVGLIVLVAWAWWSGRRSQRLLERFADSGMLGRLATSVSRPRQRLKTILSILACLSFILALSRPQWGSVTEEIELEGVDVLFAMDTSRSMLAEDYRPNRLDRAKLAIIDLVDQLQGDRIGLIAFAGEAFLQSPLTLDYSAFLQTLDAMTTDTIPRGGTDIAGAIDEAMAYFAETDHHRVLILISDGEDLEASGIQRAREAAAEGIAIFTLGVGSPEGELVPLRGPDGEVDYLRDHTGDPVRSRLDEQTLQAIAETGNGIYQRLSGGSEALDEIYASARSAVDEASMGSLTREIPIERYRWPLAFGLLCLVLEWSISTRKRTGNRKHFFAGGFRKRFSAGAHSPILLAGLALGSLCLAAQPAPASPRQAERMYQAGEYDEAITLWSEAAEADPDDPRLHYNLGNAFYRTGEFASAIDAFETALPLADVELQERIFYNLANAQYRLGSDELKDAPAKTTELWENSLQNYANSLAINPEAEDASSNREWVEQEFTTHGARIQVTPAPAAGGSVSNGGLFLPGMVLQLEAEPNSGWRFVTWQGADVEEPEEPQTEMVVQQSAEVLGVFVETRELEVISEDPEKGTAGSSGRFDRDEDVPIEAEAEDYYAFKQWKSDTLEVADPQAPETTVKLTDDGTVTATFTDAYKLEVVSEPAIAGNTGESGFYEQNSEVPIRAEARDGFEWLGWGGEHIADIADFNAPETSITLNGDREVVAQFERIWNLVVLPDRDEAGSTSGGGNFPIGAVQPIEATPNEGFTFQRWEGPGVNDPEAPSTRVEVLSQAQDVIAVFEEENGDDENDSSSDEDSESDDSQNQDSNDESSESESPESDEPEPSEDEEQSEQSDGDDAEEQESNEEQESDDEEQEPGEEQPSEPEPDESDSSQQEEEAGTRETPESLTEEEAEQLLQLLRQDARQLPLRHRPSDEGDSSTGRDW